MHKVLIVEDELITQSSLKSVLGKYYKIVDTAVSGNEAIEKAAEHQPDLILMDINLKGDIDGVTAAEKILEKHDMAILFLTFRYDEKTFERAKLVKPFGYLIKPVDTNVLKQNIDIAIRMYDEVKNNESLLDCVSNEKCPESIDDLNKNISKNVEDVSIEWKGKKRIAVIGEKLLKQFWILKNH